MRRRLVGIVIIVVVLVCLGWYRIGSGTDPATPQQSVPQSPMVSEAATSGPPVASSSPTPSVTAVLPDVVGKRLTEALLALVAAGFTDVEAVDASERGRVVVNAQNWIVQEQIPVVGSPVPAGSRIMLRVVKPSDAASGDPVTTGIVPEVVCMDLHTAQNRLRAAGLTDVRAQDGLGQGRTPLLDLNWVVIAQSAAAGSRPATSTAVVLTVVKYGEPTGTSGCRS